MEDLTQTDLNDFKKLLLCVTKKSKCRAVLKDELRCLQCHKGRSSIS